MTKSRDLGNLAQTVAVNLPTSLGTAGQSLVVNSGADGLEFGAASGGGVTVYTGLSGTDGTPSGATYLLNASNPSAGDLAYVTANTSLYQYNGSGWYRIAVINTTPTISSVADASSNTTPFTLEGGTNTVITVTASDADEGTDLTYSYSVTSGSLNGTTVTQGTGASENVFTIAPHASNATTFSLTFTVSDSINAATSVAAFTLEFSVTDSHYTSLLMATDGSAGNNQDDISDSSSSEHSITVNGDAHAGTFSPYRHGGYSVEFVDEGSNGYGLQLPAATFNNPSTTFTIEAWVYLKSYTSNATGHYNRTIMAKGATYFHFGITADNKIHLDHYDGTARYPYSNDTVPLNEWTHVCAKVDNGSITFYINGTASGTGTWYGLHSGHLNTDFYVGMSGDTNNTANNDKWWDGYLSNVRFVDGTAITPSSGGNEALDPTTANTEFLLCASNRFIDSKSTSPLTVTPYRTPEIVPIGPYDYEEYDESINGGSVYFDGSSDYLSIADSTDWDLGTSWTLEAWAYPTNDGKGFSTRASTTSTNNMWEFFIFRSTGAWAFEGYGANSTSGPKSTTGTYAVNSWYHVAYVYDGSNVKIYVNGVLDGTHSISVSWSSSYGPYIGGNASYGEWFDGYITDLRLVKGTAVYSGNFTPPTGPLTTTGGTYPSTTNVDTSITASNTKLLLKGTDAHVIDKSQGNNLKLIGTTAASTTQAKFSNTASVYFDGNSDYITIPDNELYGWGTGSWTFEVWLYITKTGGFNAIFDTRVGTGSESGNFGLGVHTTGKVQMYASPSAFYYPQGSGDVLSFNTWQHLAIVKDADTSTTTMYFNGTAASGTYSDTRNYGASQPVQIGKDDTTSNYFGGYMQDLRITKGKARYTSNFTVPSSPLKG